MLANLYNLNPIAIGIIGTILILLLSTIVISVILRKKYIDIENDLNDENSRAKGEFGDPMINDMVKDYKSALGENIDEINTAAVIEKNMSKHLKNPVMGERFIERSTSLMIILGLLGTFYGLTLSIGELVSLLTNSGDAIVSDVGSITDGLLNAITGMSVAFVTSLFGIGSSILVTILNVLFSVREHRESVIVHIEEYLDNHVGRKLAEQAAVKYGAAAAGAGHYDEEMEKRLSDMAMAVTRRMNEAAGDMKDTVKALDGTVHEFDTALRLFVDNTRDFSEFNHDLRTNIQRMNVTFDDFSQNVDKSADKIADNSNAVMKLSVAIEKLADKTK